MSILKEPQHSLSHREWCVVQSAFPRAKRRSLSRHDVFYRDASRGIRAFRGLYLKLWAPDNYAAPVIVGIGSDLGEQAGKPPTIEEILHRGLWLQMVQRSLVLSIFFATISLALLGLYLSFVGGGPLSKAPLLVVLGSAAAGIGISLIYMLWTKIDLALSH